MEERLEEVRHIVHGFSPEDLDEMVRKEMEGGSETDYNFLLARMGRVCRVGGDVLGPAIRRVCEVKDGRIIGLKLPVPEDTSKE
jgi:hypothetical protein